MARRAGFQISKEGIIKVSIKQIARSGFSNFTLSNLSQELNITKAALYWHFKNKDDILLITGGFTLGEETVPTNFMKIEKI